MRKRKQYYFISTVQYTESGFLHRKNNYFFTTLRDFRASLFEIITKRSNVEYVRNACILNRTNSLYMRAHEELSKAISEGYSSACVFFDYGNFDDAPIKL